ncbi:MAG: vWA domain-containing protein [Promethearchaeota archaeon]
MVESKAKGNKIRMKKNIKGFGKKKEQKLIKLAKIAFNKTMVEFYFPPLNLPNFIFDYTHLEGFYIDPENGWQITMNLANTPLFIEDEEYINYYHAISMHEVSHYQIIPYDGLINAKLLKAAMKHVNRNFAPIIVNVFADLIIDTKLHNKYPDLMEWELKKTYKHVTGGTEKKLSNFSNFLFTSYEKIWDFELSGKDKHSDIDSLVNRITDTILKDFENEATWEKKVTKIASYMKDLTNDTFTFIGTDGILDKGKSKRKSPDGRSTIEIPEDVLEIMDNPLENKNIDKLKQDNEDELRQKAENFAKDTPYSEFGAPAGQAGLLIDGNPLATWYRGLAKNLIEIKIFEEKPGGQVPVYPEVWRIGDPIEELDVVQTILTNSIIIPNITTRKWAFREGPGHLEEKQIPDLLIVLDSSGSMGWKYMVKSAKGRGPYHTALVASFAALHFAAQKGVKFSIINFSNRADTCNWTNNYREAERVLLRYQGGGTVLPVKSIARQCDKAETKALVLVITDFGLYNWTKSKKALIELANKGHHIVGFFIGASKIPQTRFKDLLNKVTFYPISNWTNLINLVIEEIKRYYL